MGGQIFSSVGKGKTIDEAFRASVESAKYEYGHGGYTGTIAEKHGYVLVSVPTGQEPKAYAKSLLEAHDERVYDKWGPAVAVELREGEWLFFGLASS